MLRYVNDWIKRFFKRKKILRLPTNLVGTEQSITAEISLLVKGSEKILKKM